MEIEYNIENIDDAALHFWAFAKDYKIWAFEGELGAGKTTFVAAICRLLGADRPVSSPTFSLVNEYRFVNKNGQEQIIYHSDWYRLNDTEEAINAGMEDMLQQPDAYCIVEWPQRAPELLTDGTLNVRFELVSETERRIYVNE